MPRQAVAVVLTAEKHTALERLASSRTESYRTVQRARLILLATDGMPNVQITKEVGLSRTMVVQWRQRFVRERMAGLTDRPRSGRPQAYTEEDRLRVVETACTKTPPKESHCSLRHLAKATGMKKDVVHQILRENNLKPHQVGTFSRPPDPDFVEKVLDVVELSLDPPNHAIVLCLDKKTQVEALGRTQLMLPMRPNQIERHAHDYRRNGIVQLYAALEVHAGRVLPWIEQRHRSREFISFMNQLLRTYPDGELHVILDNVITHRSKEVRDWHRHPKHQRVVFHFIPTYSSWLNPIEVLFNLVRAKVLRRGQFPSERGLVTKLLAYIEQFNQEGMVFQWTKPAEAIFRSLNCQTRH